MGRVNSSQAPRLKTIIFYCEENVHCKWDSKKSEL